MHQNLDHLTESELATLMRRYYDGESTKKLIAEFELSVTPSYLYKLFPPEKFPQYLCEYCDETLVIDRRSKSSQSLPKYERDLYCPICGHFPYRQNCRCTNCLEAEAELKAEQEAIIAEYYSQQSPGIDFDKLSFEEKVYLGTLCRSLMKENMYEIAPLDGSNAKIAPTYELQRQVYTTLLHAGVISVSPRSPLDAFDLEADSFPKVVYTAKALYELNLNYPSNKQELFTEILNPSYYSSENTEDALKLWTKIAVAECIEYLQYQLKKVGFDFTPGEKTYKTFEIILNDFSVSQIYGIVWKSVADASKMYLEKGLSRQHAANSVIGACERYAERAKINHWNLTGYRRIRDLPQSTLSAFFFNRVLKIGDMGFELPPSVL